jgi:hypothetical protein
MTDKQSGKELVEKTFVYMTSISRECRKALTLAFEQKHKGIGFDQVEPILRKEIEEWFVGRDRNLRIQHETSSSGRPGEVMVTFAGSSKDARFKFRVHGIFTLASSIPDAPSYLKTLNVYVDKRDFTR